LDASRVAQSRGAARQAEERDLARRKPRFADAVVGRYKAKRCVSIMQIHSPEEAWRKGCRRKLAVSEYGGRRSGLMVVRPSPDVWTVVLAK
jgi:hypothetical protein